MTIGKKIYLGFGSVLVILVLLLCVNIVSGVRESSARGDARTIAEVRAQIMLNRLNINNFLLSGDPRDEEKRTRHVGPPDGPFYNIRAGPAFTPATFVQPA